MTELTEHEFLFTSESVTEGHPDKIADQISDGVLDAVLTDDPYGRVACETLVNTGLVVVSGEISTDTYVDIQEIARETVRKIGYDNAAYGFDCDTCAVDDGAGVAVEAVGGVVVADLAHGLARDFLDVHVGVGGDLSGHDDQAGVDQRLAGHAAVGVVREDRVEDAVGDLVGDLVGVSLRDRLGGEQELVFG